MPCGSVFELVYLLFTSYILQCPDYKCPVKPSWSLSPIQTPAHCIWQDGGENWENASERTHGLRGKAKAAHVSRAKQGIISPFPMHREVFSPSQQSRAPSHSVTQEDKHHYLGFFRAQSHKHAETNQLQNLPAWLAGTIRDTSNEYRQETNIQKTMYCDILEGHKADFHFS